MRISRWIGPAAVLAGLAFGTGETGAVTVPPLELDDLTATRVVAPMGFLAHCARGSALCQATGGQQGPAVYDGRHKADLRDVNAMVNRQIRPKADPASRDDWQIATRSGDCEDYALRKQQELRKRGWSSSQLHLATAYIQDGQRHVVLLARTTDGVFVLDNLSSHVRSMKATGYRWEYRQSTSDPKVWLSMAPARQATRRTAKRASPPREAANRTLAIRAEDDGQAWMKLSPAERRAMVRKALGGA